MKRDSIYTELKTSLYEFYEKTYCSTSMKQQLKDYSMSAVIWMIIAAILFGIAYSIVCLRIFDQSSKTEFAELLKISPIIVPSAVVITIIVFQYVFEWLGTWVISISFFVVVDKIIKFIDPLEKDLIISTHFAVSKITHHLDLSYIYR